MRDRLQWLREVVAPRQIGEAIELGTHKGGFASQILAMTNAAHLTCVDPWLGQFYPREDPEARYAAARKRLAPFGKRVTILRDTSLAVAVTYPAAYFDLVYLDALHRYAYPDGSGIAADIRAYWPLVAAGGVFAGHDYYTRHNCGVVQAVTEFAERTGQEIHVTEGDRHPTWWTVKE